ncbi:hypothetical protein [Hymenobacter armeniacus]|uniref:Glycosyltransferase RgtA/B/C/D-like domain-containing protein n=1 Tax=Hymenobacter armeniacus TaxID=2771358 RepID=A0ABR8JRS0_9BACT|nr:hypothetical protein [Hymenobacter armeniacus]MBD2721501.1 hypothetical protein [Hymenobacter armeniacus]
MSETISVKASLEATDRRRKTADLIFLAVMVVALQGYFVQSLGFYSDDWWVLSTIAGAKGQGLATIIYYAFHNNGFIVRPVQWLDFAVLYWLFGDDPLGYHISNALILIAGTLLFYLTLMRLKVPRAVAVALPLVYAMLPHYSTTRFWLASYCANISIVFLLLNLYAGLRYIRAAENARRWNVWLAISGFSVLVCALAYEVALPIFIVNFYILYRIQARQEALRGDSSSSPLSALLFCNGLLLVASIAYKFLLSERTGGFTDSYFGHMAQVFRAALVNDFWTYGVKQPVIVWKIVRDYNSPRLFVIGAILFAAIFYYLLKISAVTIKSIDWLKVIGVGVIVYFGGYAAFLVTSNFQISAAGISNRITVAAAIGVAICFVGGTGLLCALIKSTKLRRVAFSLVLAGVACSGYIINCTISHFYSQSYVQQRAVLEKIYAIVPRLDHGSTVLLDGQCPYTGPVPVFDCDWDLSGALSMHYKDTVKADVRTRRMTYNAQGVSTFVYSGPQCLYPYSPKLMVYNAEKNRLYYLTDLKAATQYFTSISPKLEDCANVFEGEGIRIF